MDLDRYYTPERTANEVVEAMGGNAGTVFADTSCGEGQLLSAATRIEPDALCFGVDSDAKAVRALQRKHPEYHLSKGNFLSEHSRRRTKLWLHEGEIDALYLNPPFSMATTKGVRIPVEFGGQRCSVAMIHVFTALSLLKPRYGISAIVPESLVYSELDEEVRRLINKDYKLELLRELKNTTFSGARANACIVRFVPMLGKPRRSRRPARRLDWPDVEIVRGGLPVFEARTWRRGLPFVHSTDINKVVATGPDGLRRVRGIGRGRVSGHMILIPRVGVPRREQVVCVSLEQEIQLSDCVLALTCSSSRSAHALSQKMRARWQQFRGLYRGTGARYITVKRLAMWLN